MSYDMYATRCTIAKASGEFFIVKDKVFRKVGNIYKQYSEDKPCKKNNNNCYSHGMLVAIANHKENDIEFVEQK